MTRNKFHVLTFALLAGSTLAAQTGTQPAKPNSASAAAKQTQTAPSSSVLPAGAPSGSPQTESTVPANAPVITIDGLCAVTPSGATKTLPHTGAAAKSASTGSPAATASSTSSRGDCKTEITRAEFEKLFRTVTPPGTPATARRQVAAQYIQILSAANEGVKLGVDKDPDFPEQLEVMKLQLLAQAAGRKIQANAANVSDADLKAYYDRNPSAFEEVNLTRIFVPRGANEAAPAQQSADSKAIAEKAREQLAAGGDPEKIQKSVFEELKTTNAPPSTKFGPKRRGSLPSPHEQKIFAMKPGEVSEVIPDSVGSVIYRLDSKQAVPFEQAKEEVKRKITQQRLDDARQQIMGATKADFNNAYFGPESASPRVGPAGVGGGVPPGSRPPGATPGNAPAPTGSAQPQQSQPTNPK